MCVFSSSWEDGGGWGGECVSEIGLHNPQASSKANSIQLTLEGIKVSPLWDSASTGRKLESRFVVLWLQTPIHAE